MIRTAFALLVVAASSVAAHANVPAPYAVAAPQQHASNLADCSISTLLRSGCAERDVSRGHADLAPRYVVQANETPAATA